jgi:RNA polymerase sigma-70 factor, ECF subfamily
MPEDANKQPKLETLMEAYQQGDATAGDDLFSRVSRPLYRFFAAQSTDRRHADDLLQDLWLRVHKARHTYRPGDPVLPWLYAIARFVKVDAYRRRKAERFETTLEAGYEPKQATSVSAQQLPDIDQMLAGLPESQRDVILMLKVSGLSLEEVAKATGTSVGSVKQKAFRAYEKLRTRLSAFKPKEGAAK